MKEKIYNITISLICCIYAITTLVLLIIQPKYNLLFPGWWTFIIIFPALGNILFQSNKVSGTYMLISGILLLLANLEIITFIKCFTILVCLGIIILGINIIKITLNLPTNRKDTNKTLPIFYTIFGATEELASTTLSEGGKVIAICGATTIDMKNSKLKRDIVIKTKSVLGTVELLFPDNVEVISNSKNILGESLNYKKTEEKNKIKIYVDSTSILGSTKIK